jgi:ribose 1,5-bisphosphokinase
MGPSGAGKDSIMRGAVDLLPGRLAVAERLVTRRDALPPDRFVSGERMALLVECGRMALHWSCHGFLYGIEKTVERDLRRGLTVMINGSRAYFTRARELFPDLKPVLVTADPAVLRERLEKRAREGSRAIGERLLRTDGSFDLDRDGLSVIDNSKDLEGAVKLFLNHVLSLGARD